jgi:D-alanine-D-alanine ligase
MNRTFRRIAVITGDHALPDPTKRDARYNEEDLVTHAAMVAAFESLDGYAFDFCTDHGGLLDRLRADPPDLVVNFCDTGFTNVPTKELHIPALLELLDIPYTGAPPAAMVICYDKAIVRLLAQAQGVPVPREVFIAADMPMADLPDLYPALIKPNAADGSVGITKDAVVHDRPAAIGYLEWLRDTLPGRDALVQEYLPGPEYGLGLIGNPETEIMSLPPLEVDFSRLPAGLNPILSFESKALPDSPYWTGIKFKRARLPAATEAAMVAWARSMFRRLGLRDYARFDFRVAADGEPKLMEVNPNPAWANDGKLCFMAGFAGLEYRDMLRLILEAAIARIARRVD